ncbi:MAG: general secretion pathway protein GspB [Syntrophobacteraceae bacterium]
MSYILDALRKSEQERQRGTSPGLDAIQVAVRRGPKRKIVWPWLLAAILTLNAVAFVWWIGPWKAGQKPGSESVLSLSNAPAKPQKDAEAVPANGPPERAATPASSPLQGSSSPGSPGKVSPQAVDSGSFAENVNTTDLATRKGPDRPSSSGSKPPSTSLASPPLKAGPAKPADPPKAEAGAASAAVGVQQPPPVKGHEAVKSDDPKRGVAKSAPPPASPAQPPPRPLAPQTQIGAAEMGLIEDLKPLISETRPARKEPEYRQIPASIKNDIPRLSLSFLVYSDKPAERRVTINGKVLREGDEISDGLKLEKITHEGAIFNFKGFQFHKGVF